MIISKVPCSAYSRLSFHAQFFLNFADGGYFHSMDYPFRMPAISAKSSQYSTSGRRRSWYDVYLGQNPGCSAHLELGIGIHSALATGNLGRGLLLMHSTLFTMRRKRLPRSTMVAATPSPCLLVNTRRAVSLSIPMLRRCTSSFGFCSAISGQTSNMCACRMALFSPSSSAYSLEEEHPFGMP